jgi:hypothetical protein
MRAARSVFTPLVPPPSTPPSPLSFPGLYESMHHKVRGQWDQEVWGNYLNYKAKMQALPWDPAHGDMTEEKLKDMKTAIATKAGVTPAQLGW